LVIQRRKSLGICDTNATKALARATGLQIESEDTAPGESDEDQVGRPTQVKVVEVGIAGFSRPPKLQLWRLTILSKSRNERHRGFILRLWRGCWVGVLVFGFWCRRVIRTLRRVRWLFGLYILLVRLLHHASWLLFSAGNQHTGNDATHQKQQPAGSNKQH